MGATHVRASRRRTLRLDESSPFFVGLFLLAIVGFWPTYVTALGQADAYIHFHAGTMTLWIALLTAQPLLIRLRKPKLHRRVGSASYGLVPLIIVAAILIAHDFVQTEGIPAAERRYFFFIQVQLTVAFVVAYALAMVYRSDSALHSRYMVCTALPLIDPALARILQRHATLGFRGQWITFAVIDAILVFLIVRDRHARRGRPAFVIILAIFAVLQVLNLYATETGPWMAFTTWFAGLRLT
jgi:hypothetical protein